MKPLPVTVFRQSSQDKVATTAYTLVIAALVCGFLYFGREILIPVALAILFTFLLAPLVRAMQKLRFPKSLSVALVMLGVVVVLGSLSYMVTLELRQLAVDLPKYETNLRTKISSLKSFSNGKNEFQKAGSILGDLGDELNKTTQTEEQMAADKPMLVAIADTKMGLFGNIPELFSPLLNPILQSGIVAIFVIFFMLQREDLRNRVIKLAGRGDLLKSTEALNDAASKLSKMFVASALINLTFGILVGIALMLLGVPNAILWGIFAILMRFIPYVGAALSALFPVAIAIAISPGWALPAAVIGLFVVLEIIVSQVVEPVAFGHSSGLSPVAVIASAAFWVAIWGPVGLILSTPLTICLVVLGRHVEGLRFFEVLLGTGAPLTPAETFYQRLLAGDRQEAADQIQVWLRNDTMVAFIDSVAVPVLRLADSDRIERRVDDDKLGLIAHQFSDVLEDGFVPDAIEAGRTDFSGLVLVPAPGVINFAATVALSASLSAAGISHKMLDQDAASPLVANADVFREAKAVYICFLCEPSADRLAFVSRRMHGKVQSDILRPTYWVSAAHPDTIRSQCGIFGEAATLNALSAVSSPAAEPSSGSVLAVNSA